MVPELSLGLDNPASNKPVTVPKAEEGDGDDEEAYDSGVAAASAAVHTTAGDSAQAPGQLRHFIIKGLVPSCTNLLVKRLGLACWKVEVQVGHARIKHVYM